MIKCPKCGTDYDGAERFCPKDGTRLGTGESKLPRIPSISPGGDPLINKIIQGRYKVLEQIGEGGMGVVYVAEHVEIEKKVAIKVLRDDFSKRPEVVARFRQEARSASKIGSAHIVDVTDFGQLDNGGVFFVMEHLKGKGLSDIIRSEVITLPRAANIVLQIAKALKAAHKLGIVHRDLKPENIFLVEGDDQEDFVKILDFGIAKISDRDSEGQRLTKTGMIFGTPEYMSPEQAAGKPLDHRVDIYALGCIMFEMFTGVVPYEGETFMAVLTQHMFEPIPKIEELNPENDANDSVKAVVYRAMAKDKDERYPDMESLAKDLMAAMSGEKIEYTIGRNDENSGRLRLTSSGRGYTAEQGMKWTPDLEIEKGKRAFGIRITVAIGAIAILIGGIAAAPYISGYFGDKSGGKQEGKEEIKTSVELEDKNRESIKKVTVEQETAKEKKDTEKNKEENINKNEIKKIIVSIKTDPEGARIFVEGKGQVCSETPCEVGLEEGVHYSLKAKKDGKSQTLAVIPSEHNNEVFIEIVKREKREKKRLKTKNGKKREKKNGDGTGLKIPDIFKDN